MKKIGLQSPPVMMLAVVITELPTHVHVGTVDQVFSYSCIIYVHTCMYGFVRKMYMVCDTCA